MKTRVVYLTRHVMSMPGIGKVNDNGEYFLKLYRDEEGFVFVQPKQGYFYPLCKDGNHVMFRDNNYLKDVQNRYDPSVYLGPKEEDVMETCMSWSEKVDLTPERELIAALNKRVEEQGKDSNRIAEKVNKLSAAMKKLDPNFTIEDD